jgi:hypothetical protein
MGAVFYAVFRLNSIKMQTQSVRLPFRLSASPKGEGNMLAKQIEFAKSG